MAKNWLITGTSAGLGRIMTEKLLARGDRVVATVRSRTALAELERRHEEKLIVETVDITDTAALRAVVDRAFQRLGRIDTVVSNAGYGLFGAAEEATDAQVERQIATNLLGSIQLIRACLPHLRQQHGGRILQISSEGGQIAYPNFSLYHATKWGIEGFVEAVAQEVASFGIDFVLVEPGPTATQFGAGLDHTPLLEVYDATPAGDVRRAIASGKFAVLGDAARTVDAIITAADAERPPFRLPLGSSAFSSIRAALQSRLGELADQEAVAASADTINA